MASIRRSFFTAAQWLLAAAIVWYAIRALQGQWSGAADRLQTIRPHWPMLLVATAIVALTYLLLIEAWRRVIRAAGEEIAPGPAARIWFVSNLGKYVPGKVWSITTMAVMANRSGVSAGTAAGSSLLVQLVSLATGLGVVLVTGAEALDQPVIAAVAAAGILLVLVALPRLIPLIGRTVSTVVRRTVDLPVLPASAVWGAAVRSALAWIAYGLAFQLFTRAVLGSAAGAATSYIAVFAASYIAGFLALFAPGGAVVREGAMISAMLRLGLAGQADALVIAIASRLWLTVTEVLPGFAYLAAGKRAVR